MARLVTLGCAMILLVLTSTASVFVVLAWMRIFDNNDQLTLRFTENGTFQISIFSSPYDGTGDNHEWERKETRQMHRLMNTVLDLEHPQLAILNGDIVVQGLNITQNMKNTVPPLLEHDTPWASIYVDHESDWNASRHHVLAQEQQWSNSLTRQDVNASRAGVSNYLLPVFANSSSDADADTPLLLLWFFDSRGGYHYRQLDSNGRKVAYPNGVDDTVVIWFQEKKQELRDTYGAEIPSLAFVHAPVSAMAALRADAGHLSHDHSDVHARDPVESQQHATDTVFMYALLDTPKLLAVFSGSDGGEGGCFE